VENVDWDEPTEIASPLERWTKHEQELARRLLALGVPNDGIVSCRADLKEGRLLWVDEASSPMVEARAQILCSYSPLTGMLTMAWADPVLVGVGVPRVEGQEEIRGVPDLESACDVALRLAEACGAEFVHRVPGPAVDYFLGLRALRSSAGRILLTPGSPVGVVLRGLHELKRCLSTKSEPTDVLRNHFARFGRSLLELAEGEFKESEWATRLQRAGRLVSNLAARLTPPTFTAIAAGIRAEEWLTHDVAVELTDALKLLEDEWAAFS
jgi:hypothetical protein